MLQNLRLVDKSFCTAVGAAAVALKPKKSITADQLGRLCNIFPKATSLDLLSSCIVTDIGLAHLRCLASSLKHLKSGSWLSDAGAAHLATLTRLESLTLRANSLYLPKGISVLSSLQVQLLTQLQNPHYPFRLVLCCSSCCYNENPCTYRRSSATQNNTPSYCWIPNRTLPQGSCFVFVYYQNFSTSHHVSLVCPLPKQSRLETVVTPRTRYPGLTQAYLILKRLSLEETLLYPVSST